MPKKKIRQKHQTAPDDSTDTSDEESQAQQSKCCPHISKSVSVAGLKKNFKTGFNFGECQACQKAVKNSSEPNVPLTDDDLLNDDSTWLCLQCGHQGCGRNSSQHSLLHYSTSHSDCHKLVINSTSWAIWCYECDDEVSAESNRRLTECVDFIRKQVGVSVKKNVPTASGSNSSVVKAENVVVDEPTKMGEMTAKNVKPPNGLIISVPKVKGLSNLGNTCFFNAVMQNLTQSITFVEAFRSQCLDNTVWTWPKDCIADFEPNLEVFLPECGPLTKALSDFFNIMHLQGKNGIASPNHLFGQICKKSPQFRGYQQQDSHELLRQLLDGVRTEEVKRQKKGILRAFGLSEKVNNTDVDEELKPKIKAYGRQANYTIVDKVFGGQLVSTVLCEECHQSSQVIEPFMDLSLPVGEEKPTRPSQRRSLSSDDPPEPMTFGKRQAKKDDSKPSKYQEKKNKKQAKKEAKRQVKAAKASTSKLNISAEENQELEQVVGKEISDDDDISGNDLTDADVEDNDETETSSRHSPMSSSFQIEVSVPELGQSNSMPDSTTEPFENGYELENDAQQKVPEILTESSENCTEICAQQITTSENVFQETRVPQNSCDMLTCNQEEIISLTKHMDIDVMQPECSSQALSLNFECSSVAVDEINVEADVVTNQDHLSESSVVPDGTGDDLCAKMARLSIRRRSESKDSLLETPEDKICNGVGDDAATPADDHSVGSTDSGIGNGKREMQTKAKQIAPDPEDLAHSLTTLAPRYQPSSHECSIMSCLHQFTLLELLSGNNKFGCETCTKNKAAKSSDKNSKEEKVYSNASKQLLILSPPAILTLHLKRFQQVGMSLKKVNKFVEFPLVLDLAPFCSSLALGLPHMKEGQQQILYSLYGVVEHSGRLTGGHYTAYVKVRKTTKRLSYLNEFPVGPQEINRMKMEMARKYAMQDSASEMHTDSVVSNEENVWYHISDSSVVTASESAVLRCQAYLLFYERIM